MEQHKENMKYQYNCKKPGGLSACQWLYRVLRTILQKRRIPED